MLPPHTTPQFIGRNSLLMILADHGFLHLSWEDRRLIYLCRKIQELKEEKTTWPYVHSASIVSGLLLLFQILNGHRVWQRTLGQNMLPSLKITAEK